MNNKKRILYIMSVDWSWIAQRPHFMALELQKEYDVTVLYPRYLYRPWKSQQNLKAPEKCYGVPQIPFQERFRVLQRFGDVIFRKYIGDIQQYDIIWLGTPMFARLISREYKGIVVYDYMDDIAALQSSEKVAAYVRRAHKYLLRKADLVMVTSQYLMDSLNKQARKKAHLVRNAFRNGTNGGLNMVPVPDSPKAGKDRTVRAGYVGTISGWMDFPLLLWSLEKFPNLEYHFWGPAAVRLPEHERLIFHGVIEHEKIRDAVQDMDCLIMPFQVNDIVRAVDPVKLYEYISFGKNIIAVRYPEIERFDPFVWFYRDRKEYAQIIGRLARYELQIRYNADRQKQFLEKNSWEERGRIVRSLLAEYTKDSI